jgi:hypothetical protein
LPRLAEGVIVSIVLPPETATVDGITLESDCLISCTFPVVTFAGLTAVFIVIATVVVMGTAVALLPGLHEDTVGVGGAPVLVVVNNPLLGP